MNHLGPPSPVKSVQPCYAPGAQMGSVGAGQALTAVFAARVL
jgi:hypothetical protein